MSHEQRVVFCRKIVGNCRDMSQIVVTFSVLSPSSGIKMTGLSKTSLLIL